MALLYGGLSLQVQSEECIEKTAQTVKYLACPNASQLVLTGEPYPLSKEVTNLAVRSFSGPFEMNRLEFAFSCHRFAAV